MQERSSKSENENEKPPGEGGEWEKDQAERSYYYDDAHGYVVYSPEDDEDLAAEREDRPADRE